jgi:hypothetical protein
VSAYVREEKSKKIGNHEYVVRQLPATKAQRLFVRLTKLAGPAIAEITSGGKAGIKTAAALIFGQLNESDVEDITKQMAAMSEVDNKPLDKVFEVHFTGKHSELWQWLLFALEVQYQDFFDVLLNLFKQEEARAAEESSPSQTTSGGQPGASL